MLTETQQTPSHMRQSNITNAPQSISNKNKTSGGVFRIQLDKITCERGRQDLKKFIVNAFLTCVFRCYYFSDCP